RALRLLSRGGKFSHLNSNRRDEPSSRENSTSLGWRHPGKSITAPGRDKIAVPKFQRSHRRSQPKPPLPQGLLDPPNEANLPRLESSPAGRLLWPNPVGKGAGL